MNSPEITKIYFLDIETVPNAPDYEALPENWKNLWSKKAYSLKINNSLDYNRAGIYAEFGKIICIGVGKIILKDGKYVAKIGTFHNFDEYELLKEFVSYASRWHENKAYLCAHNGYEFDFPYIIRRLLINKLQIPEILDCRFKEASQMPWLDTMHMWRFGDDKSFTSLELLCNCFGIESPKNDINGSMVWKVYWHENDLERIAKYCKNDIVALIKVFLALNSIDLEIDFEIV